jgi:hypothetical protein
LQIARLGEVAGVGANEGELKKSGAFYVEAGLKVPEIVFDRSAYT